MGYKEDFAEVLKKLTVDTQANLVIFPNTDPQKMKSLPKRVDNEMMYEYRNFLEEAVTGRNFADFGGSSQTSDVLVANISQIDFWKKVLCAKEEIRSANNVDYLEMDKMRGAGNVVMMEIQVKPDENIYLLTVYRNVAYWYAECIFFVEEKALIDTNPVKRLKKKARGANNIHRIKGSIVALPPCVAAVIHNDRCYIVDVGDFTKIFKYPDIVNAQFEMHKGTINQLKFISDADALIQKIGDSVRWKKELLTAINSGRLREIADINSTDIKKRIEAREEFRERIFFDFDSKIDVERSKIGDVVGILSDRIHIDLIRDALVGREGGDNSGEKHGE